MNVNLGETFDRFVMKLIQGGQYQSQSEVVREGLRLLKEREDLRSLRILQLKADIDKGLQEIESGNFKEYNKKSLHAVFEASKARARKKKSAHKARAA